MHFCNLELVNTDKRCALCIDEFIKQNCIDGEQLAEELKENLLLEYEN